MTFSDYIRKRRITDTPTGDFTYDARAARLPDMTSWTELRLHLEGNGACDEAIQAAHSVWRQYQRTKEGNL